MNIFFKTTIPAFFAVTVMAALSGAPATQANAAGMMVPAKLSQAETANAGKIIKVGRRDRRWRRRAVGAGIAGAIIGGAIASGGGYGAGYRERRGYSRDCWYERVRRYDRYGNRYYKRIRVCD